jgi:8-oxo-dGTP pyrophosphatase MutT (NUDIX family)
MTQPEAAVAIVHTRSAGESVLLMRRTVREHDSWSGQWSFPGGRCDPVDRDAVDTALRELLEECGIRLTRDDLDRPLPVRLARRRSGPYVPVAPFLFSIPGELPSIPCQHETAETRWVPLDMLRDPQQHRLLPVPGMPDDTRFPAIDLRGLPLWGFTYRLITDWLDIAEHDPAAGLAAAKLVLQYLLSRGLSLERDWDGGAALVRGEIPVQDVLQHFSQPGPYVAAVNRLHALPDSVQILGPSFEEYWIRAIS